MILFGVTVVTYRVYIRRARFDGLHPVPFQLINRQKAAKKKGPTPLTADMLNELNKNHMGGIDNYGQEDLYNLDDAWDDHANDVKPKVCFLIYTQPAH